MENNWLSKYFGQDLTGFWYNEAEKKYRLKDLDHETTRVDKALEQAKMKPVSHFKVYFHINDFLELISKENGREEKNQRRASIKIGNTEHPIIDNGIFIYYENEKKYEEWRTVFNNTKKTYDFIDPKYNDIKNGFKIEGALNLLWFKFTEKGHLAVVAKGIDINWKYNNTSGKLVKAVNDYLDESFVFAFPITKEMLPYNHMEKGREESIKDLMNYLERGVGNYLIDKGVPIIDYYSHMN